MSATKEISAADGNRPGLRSQEVYERLRWDIVHGVLRANQPLVEAEIAAELQTSRTPVRESMQRLAAEGLIVSHRRRWVVYEFSADEVREIYEVRSSHEGFAARLACVRATDEELAELAKYRSTSPKVSAERVAHNDLFHRSISDLAKNSRLAQIIDRENVYYFSYRLAALYSDDDMKISAAQHVALVEAVCRRDEDTAEKTAREHVMFSLGLVLSKLYF